MLYQISSHGLCEFSGSSSQGHLSVAYCVGYLLKPLEKTSDPGLQAAIACVKNDTEPAEGKHYKFKPMATSLLPNCPVAK